MSERTTLLSHTEVTLHFILSLTIGEVEQVVNHGARPPVGSVVTI